MNLDAEVTGMELQIPLKTRCVQQEMIDHELQQVSGHAHYSLGCVNPHHRQWISTVVSDALTKLAREAHSMAGSVRARAQPCTLDPSSVPSLDAGSRCSISLIR